MTKPETDLQRATVEQHSAMVAEIEADLIAEKDYVDELVAVLRYHQRRIEELTPAGNEP